MCLTVDPIYHNSRPITTTRPLIVFKFVQKTNDPTRFRAPYRSDFIWYSGSLVETTMSVQKRGYMGTLEVHRGLHAFITKAAADERNWGGSHVVVPCVIPAGSKVYLGARNEIVSNQLILYSTVKALKLAHGMPLKKSWGAPVHRSLIGKKPA